MTESVVSATQPMKPAATANAEDRRPGLMIASNSITPYRVHQHCLMAERIPELKLHTVITHGVGDFDWQMNLPSEIHPANFSTAGEHPLDNPLRRPLVEIRKGADFIRFVQENDVRAVILYGYRYISYIRLITYCYRNGIPFFLHSDSNIRSEKPLSPIERAAKKLIYKWMLKRASGVMSMGQYGDQFFLKYGATPAQIYRVPGWPDYDSFSQVDPHALQGFRRRYGLNAERRYILFSGRLIGLKRVDLLIDAFAKIAHDRPEWDVLMCGDGKLRSELQARVPKNIEHRFVWTGFLEHDDLILAYHSADVLVLPSEKEAWALVVQEAMAAGLAVIASDIVGASREMVTDGVSGRIFESGNCEALRESLEDVTHPGRIAEYKAQSVAALQRYRREVDPIAEMRRALAEAGALPAAAN